MRSRFSQNSANEVKVDLTPMIDMVFILLIFFLVTASFNKLSAVDIERPTAQVNDIKGAVSIVIAIDQRSGVWLDGKPIDVRKLRQRVKTLAATGPASVIINADRSVVTGRLIEVLDQVRLAGVTNVAVATAQE